MIETIELFINSHLKSYGARKIAANILLSTKKKHFNVQKSTTNAFLKANLNALHTFLQPDHNIGIS